MVEVLNINPGNNEELLSKCKTLREYVWYIECVRKYVADMPIELAVEHAVNECIREGILEEFLSHNKAEAIEMSIFEYNQEAHMECVRQEGYDEGRAEGRAEIIYSLVNKKLLTIEAAARELGVSADELMVRLEKSNNNIH